MKPKMGIVADCLGYNKSKTNRFFEMLFSPAAARRVAPQLARVRSVVCSLTLSGALWCALWCAHWCPLMRCGVLSGARTGAL